MRTADYSAQCWVFRERCADASDYGRSYRFDFSYIHSQMLRKELQKYVWQNYRGRSKTLATLRQEHCWLRYYEQWLYQRGVQSLAWIDEADVEGFLSYLNLCLSKKTGRPLQRMTQKHIYDAVRSVYVWYSGSSPRYAQLAGYFATDAYPKIGERLRTQSAQNGYAQALTEALRRSDNPCLKHGLFLLLATGLTPSQLLTLRTDALEYRAQGVFLRYYHQRKRQYHTIPVSSTCERVFQELRAQTARLRAVVTRTYRKRLFLYETRDKRVIPPSPDLFRYWLRCLQLQELDMAAGQKPLTCTQLRVSLMRELSEHQIPQVMIQELTGSVSDTERGQFLCV